MATENQFTIELAHLENYEFNVKFDLQGVEDLLVDETPPVGEGKGPNPSRMIAVAAANCLSASLLFCLFKNDPPAAGLNTSVTCNMIRNDKGRMRIGNLQVRLTVTDELEQAVKMKRCLELFEDFCVATASLREGFPVDVEVVTKGGEHLHQHVI